MDEFDNKLKEILTLIHTENYDKSHVLELLQEATEII